MPRFLCTLKGCGGELAAISPKTVLWVAGHSGVEGGLSPSAERQQPQLRGGGYSAGVRPVTDTIRPDLGGYKETKDTLLVLGTRVPVGKTETDIRS